jgi:hypothetical protein
MLNRGGEIRIMPDRVTASVRSSVVADRTLRQSASWQEALSAAREMLPGWKKMGFVFSDLWVRYDMVKLGNRLMDNKDMDLLARAHFASSHPDCASWPIRHALCGEHLLVCAMDPEFFAAMQSLSADSGASLVRAEPLFSTLFDSASRDLSDFSGWLLIDEPGMLIACWIDKGIPLSIHQRLAEGNHGEAAGLLLQRLSAQLGVQSQEVRVLSCMEEPIALDGFQVRRIETKAGAHA